MKMAELLSLKAYIPNGILKFEKIVGKFSYVFGLSDVFGQRTGNEQNLIVSMYAFNLKEL